MTQWNVSREVIESENDTAKLRAHIRQLEARVATAESELEVSLKEQQDELSTLESELQQLRVERDGLRKACSRIERWFGEFPQVPEKGHMVSYVVAYGSNGERNFMRSIARAALAPAPAARTETE